MAFAKDPDPVAAPRLGVYIHFPWCRQKCPYCDFLSVATPDTEIPQAAYADCVIQELERRRSTLGSYRLGSIFVGGGTPSLWAPAELGRVLAAVTEAWPNHEEPLEVTIECNPSSLDEVRARAFADVGVNRLSIGVQGLDNRRLAFLGRLHDAGGAVEAVRAALGEPRVRVSADLIFGVAGQSPDAATDEVLRIVELGVGHVSAYALTIEPNTRFGALARSGRLPVLEDDLQAEAFSRVARSLEARGFEHYEISNYAKARQECRHNLGYWRGDDYLGLGCGAWGTVSALERPLADAADPRVALRYRNTLSPARYLDIDWQRVDPSEPGSWLAEREVLSPETRLSERIMLGLRTNQGIVLEEAALRLGVDPWTAERRRACDRLVESQRLLVDGGRLRIPKEKWAFADAIAAELM